MRLAAAAAAGGVKSERIDGVEGRWHAAVKGVGGTTLNA